ncbi:MAG TPA: hypothetical protein VM600_07375 [Actinomycetota bacterium]|nr:hypothetical protein [Actinomycetota bacterium]
MRKVLLLALVCAFMIGAVPAQSHGGSHNVTFPVAGTVPCGVPGGGVDLCAYNIIAETAGYKACENPFPPGSWIDKVTEAAPTPPSGKKVILVFESSPMLDWDTWICANTSARTQLAQGANIFGENCDNIVGPDNPLPIGCQEKAQAPATPGRTYILRAYNYSDIADLHGKYTWLFV